MRSIANFIRRQQFDPGLLGPLVNPFFLARRSLKFMVAQLAPELSGHVIDIGCGTMPYRDVIPSTRYVGLEIDTDHARRRGIAHEFYDGRHMPFPDGHFDSALCNQVLEHVFNPDQFLAEIARILKPNGRLLLTVPFVWDEHEQPHDFARYSSFGLRHLLTAQGFRILEQRKTLADVSIIGQLINAYFYKIGWSGGKLAQIVLLAIVFAPTSYLFLALGKLLPSNDDLYLDNVILAERA